MERIHEWVKTILILIPFDPLPGAGASDRISVVYQDVPQVAEEFRRFPFEDGAQIYYVLPPLTKNEVKGYQNQECSKAGMIS